MNGGLKKDRIPSMYKYNQTIEVKNIVRGILLHYYLTFSHIFFSHMYCNHKLQQYPHKKQQFLESDGHEIALNQP